MVVAMIFIILLVGIFAFFMFKSEKSKDTNKKSKKNAAANKEKSEEQLKGIKRVGNTVQRKDIFDFMEFDSIEDDMIIQNGGNRYTMVIQCKGINYDLMSDIEQLAVEEGFIVFLNTLKYPIQLYVQARSIDLKKSMNIYNKRVKMFGEQFAEYDEAFRKKINTFDSTEDEIEIARNERAKFANIYEYAQDINRYVERLSTNKNILQRKFFIALSYSRNEITASGSFSDEEIREICHRELYTRANSLVSSLMSCSVVGRTLDSEELVELLFASYNRDDERLFDVSTALDADFYRLYSTSKDIYDKKREKIQEEISKEAIRRVQDALKATVREEEIKTEEQIEEEFEEAADREAINIIRGAEIDKETKEELTNIVAQNHVINARERRAKRARIKEKEMLEKEETEVENETNKDNFVDRKEKLEDVNNENLDLYEEISEDSRDESDDSIV